ncbi:MAG TPA: SpoIID/LytB domain-containing protein [Firmicutes bacterium]|jgi:stage II sporulation protein D|nr:SpoIID/LytB domain-containing protein [Bacillota bacterium]
MENSNKFVAVKALVFFVITVALFSILIFLAGCNAIGMGGNAQPSLPGGLEADEGKEPRISVYIAEKETVEEMPIEEYIAGVVAGEMDPNWPLSALAAQAIIARTFTLQQIDEKGGVPGRNAHASTDTEEFQAYSTADITPRVREAVELTRGKAICYRNQFIRAWFSAYAGPRTARADEGLSFEGKNPPYIHIVASPGEEIIPSEEANWSAIFPLERVREVIGEATGRDPGVVERVEIKKKGPSGRAVTFAVNDQKISGPGMRLGLGSKEMRSTYIDEMNVQGNMLHLSGTGFGHGVGMCQWGARALAEQGKTPEDIINYFYRKIKIIKLWD